MDEEEEAISGLAAREADYTGDDWARERGKEEKRTRREEKRTRAEVSLLVECAARCARWLARVASRFGAVDALGVSLSRTSATPRRAAPRRRALLSRH
jgi:hypothetical protein